MTSPKNSPARVLVASLIGTAIEFFDFYIYATAAVLVFPKLFFPASNPTTATLQSLATFAVAFFARPIGSAVFGHFGDRVGRKATLVAALMTMGLSTVCIGLLPTHAQIGVIAPILLALCRFGQGLGLGGEWGGAILLATENAPPGKRAWYGMFPQLGAPIGFILSGGIFLLLSRSLSDAQFFAWGWRVPFLASSLLVMLGLYVRLKLHETPVFQKALDRHERVEVPMFEVFRKHFGALVLGTMVALLVFVLFYLMTVFTLAWGTKALGYTRGEFLVMQLFGMLFFGLTIPLSGLLADRHGRRITQVCAAVASLLFGLVFARLFHGGDPLSTTLFLALGLALMGLSYGPLGTTLSELFPTSVRYTGASLTFNLAGIFGASLAPYAAMWLAQNKGLQYTGYYLSAAAAVTLVALALTRETKDEGL
ncbi:MAG TPA: MFS transporter [Fibrobacteria bacterium]|jgi:metabolite-proton symporter|nr:MFS transporter [Fibrobacteria bacterium]